jgi:hypothetical protein
MEKRKLAIEISPVKETLLKRPFYQYPVYHLLATRMLNDRETGSVFSPDWIHPDLVHQLLEVDKLLINHGGLTDIQVVANVIQQWEEGRGGHKLDIGPAYHESNTSQKDTDEDALGSK